MLESNFLTSLIDVGNDAFKNLYYASFQGGEFKTNSDQFTVRLKGFDVPEDTHESYPVKFMNAQVDYPVSKVNVTRHFDLTFRLDANYVVYKKLLKQQNKVFNLSKLITVTDLKEIESDLFTTSIYVSTKNKIEGIDQSGNTTFENLFNFKKCWISSLSLSEFSTDDSSPMEVTAHINFLEKEDLVEESFAKNK